MITDKQTRISDFLSREEIRQFSQRSNLWGLWCIFSVWLIIGLA
ncbi:UNVERIFIED_CONTAM: fatty acid desaturase, partial [Cronobacter sakazakii]